jgi:hypothetical protein
MPVIEVDPIEFLAGEPEMILASSDSGKGQNIWRRHMTRQPCQQFGGHRTPCKAFEIPPWRLIL